MATRPSTTKRKTPPRKTPSIDTRRFADMAAEATIDAYGESEQAAGWYNMFEEHLELPFETIVLGMPVMVIGVELRGDDRIVAICERGRARQAIGILDLPLPASRPAGTEWIEAYRHWRRGM